MTEVTRDHVAFSLGANLADRAAALGHAQLRLSEVSGYQPFGVSDLYETDPVGGPNQPNYLNQVVVLRSDDPPESVDMEYRALTLLAVCQSIERDLDRVRNQRWGPRTLDVDILALGDFTSDDPDVTIPHPRLAERAFVLVPWAQIDPTFQVPGLGLVRDLAARLSANALRSVRRYQT